jgi:O-antigen ligase
MAFNMYLNIAIAACFWLIKTQKEKRTRFLWIIPIIIFYIAIVTSNGRIGILACNLLIAIGIIYLLGEKYKKITLGTLIIFGALGCFILFNNQKIKKQLESNHDTRYDIWTESFSLFLDHPWLGVGVSTNISNITDVFIESEVIKKDEFLIQSCLHPDVMGAHPHNQLLQSSMEFGLLGLVCMGCMLFLPFVYCIKQRSDMMITSCWILILIQMQTEVIRGSYGDLAFGIYMLLAMNYAQQSSKKVVGSMQGHDQLPSAT